MWVYDPVHMNYCGSLNRKVSFPSLKYPVCLPEGSSIKRQRQRWEGPCHSLQTVSSPGAREDDGTEPEPPGHRVVRVTLEPLGHRVTLTGLHMPHL